MNSIKRTTANGRNLRTALAFGGVAAVFFVGIIVVHAVGASVIGVPVVGAAALVFLAIAIGRNLRK